MKKIYISLIALSVAAISCTKSELVQTPDLGGQEISFDTYLGKAPMTKATSADIATLQTAGKGFDVKAFIHSGTAKPQTFTTADIYMEKAVYWKGATSTEFSYADDKETIWYIFSDAAEQPDLSGNTFDGETIPTGWTDEPGNASLWMAYSTKNADGWSAWTVEEYKNQAHADGIWEYDGVTYWPDPNSQKYLSFAAWGVNTITAGTGEDPTHTSSNTAIDFGTSENVFTFTVADVVANQQDLLVAPFQYGKAINSAGTNTTVNLQFMHVLSRVGFKLVANQDDNSVEIKVTNVNLKGSFASKGTVDITAAKPSIIAAAEDYKAATEYKLLPETTDFFATYSQEEEVDIYNNKATVTLGNSVKVEPAAETDPTNRYMMIIPTLSSTQATDYVITVEYQLTDAEKETATVTLPDTFRFAAGKSYEFVLKVSTSKVGFYVEVSDWEEGTVEASYPLTPENN